MFTHIEQRKPKITQQNFDHQHEIRNLQEPKTDGNFKEAPESYKEKII